MLDIKLIRNDPDFVRQTLRRRGQAAEAELDTLLEWDQRRRGLLVDAEERRALRNRVSQEIATAKKSGEDAEDKITAMRAVGTEIRTLEAELKEIDSDLEKELLEIPNLPDPTAPAGGEEESTILHTWGEPPTSASPCATTWNWPNPRI